jgi:hypothetical protein
VRHTAVLSGSTFLESSVSYQKGRRGSNLDREGRFEPILILLASGFQQTGAPFNGKQDRTSKRFQLAQSFTWNPHGQGRHEIKAGWDFNDTGVTGFNNVVNDVEYPPPSCRPPRSRTTRTASPASASRSPRRGSSSPCPKSARPSTSTSATRTTAGTCRTRGRRARA